MPNIQQNVFESGANAASAQSAYFDVSGYMGYCVFASITGTAVGTIKLQASNDAGGYSLASGGGTNYTGSPTSTNWVDVDNSTQTIQAGQPYLLNTVGFVNYNWVQLIYTPTSGTGTLYATYSIKEFGN